MTFADLGLIDPLLQALTALEHSSPTPIQRQAIPAVLAGRDLLAAAAQRAERIEQAEQATPPPSRRTVRPGTTGALARRDLAILELLYATGARVAELCGLDLGDVDVSQRTVRVIGKGDKERMVPYGEPAARALDGWLAVRGRLTRPDGVLTLHNPAFDLIDAPEAALRARPPREESP